MKDQLHVKDLLRAEDQRKKNRQRSFEQVLTNIYTRMKSLAGIRHTRCMYQVPEFMFGYPLYTLNECIAFIHDRLSSSGFVCTYYFPNVLYISWDTDEIENKKLRRVLSPPDGSSSTTAMTTSLIAVPAKKGRPRGRKNVQTVAAAAPQGAIVPSNKSSFIKSIKDFKTSGKLVLDLN